MPGRSQHLPCVQSAPGLVAPSLPPISSFLGLLPVHVSPPQPLVRTPATRFWAWAISSEAPNVNHFCKDTFSKQGRTHRFQVLARGHSFRGPTVLGSSQRKESRTKGPWGAAACCQRAREGSIPGGVCPQPALRLCSPCAGPPLALLTRDRLAGLPGLGHMHSAMCNGLWLSGSVGAQPLSSC